MLYAVACIHLYIPSGQQSPLLFHAPNVRTLNTFPIQVSVDVFTLCIQKHQTIVVDRLFRSSLVSMRPAWAIMHTYFMIRDFNRHICIYDANLLKGPAGIRTQDLLFTRQAL